VRLASYCPTGPDGGTAGSLLALLDRTTTAAGSRLLRCWLTTPLADLAALQRRQAAVAELAEGGAKGTRWPDEDHRIHGARLCAAATQSGRDVDG